MNKSHSILIVDDDNTHRNMLKMLLMQWGYSVKEAIDGQDAIDICKKYSFDLILMDVRMPRKNGVEALREIKKDFFSTPILIMTAFSDVSSAVEAIKAGAYDYLTKPLDFDKLKSIIIILIATSSKRKKQSAEKNTFQPTENNIIGQSPAIAEALYLIKVIANSDATVLITGESGTGKELAAKAIHMNSPRKNGPYVAINCAAISETLLESELFGHEKGAFTGAEKRHEGRFIQAHGGTLFLDEIGEMLLNMQVKLLRVLQEREVMRVGGSNPIKTDLRIITATNRDLMKEVECGRFREDLYYRLNVVTVSLPPLRERKEDIPLLANHFLDIYAKKNNKSVSGITSRALEYLLQYTWPGNIRELENIIERAVVLLIGDRISEKELPEHLLPSSKQNNYIQEAKGTTLEDIEREVIIQTLEKVGGNKTKAAELLGITRKTLHAKLQKYQQE